MRPAARDAELTLALVIVLGRTPRVTLHKRMTFGIVEVAQRVPVITASSNIDDELRRLVPYALRDLILNDGSRVVAVLSWDRDSIARVESTTGRAFVTVKARVLVFSRYPGQIALVVPKSQRDGALGGANVVVNGGGMHGTSPVRVRLQQQLDDDTWVADRV